MTKFNAAGSALVYSTFLGGISPTGIAVDSAGNAYVTGSTSATDFPTKNAFQATAGGGHGDAFVTKLNATGSALVYSTYLGGSGQDYATGIAVDGSGDAYVTGNTDSTNFPTTPGSLQPVLQGRRAGLRDRVESHRVGAGLFDLPRRLGWHLCQWHRRGRLRQRLCDGLVSVRQLPDDPRGLPVRFCRRRLRGEVECHGFGTGLRRPARGSGS